MWIITTTVADLHLAEMKLDPKPIVVWAFMATISRLKQHTVVPTSMNEATTRNIGQTRSKSDGSIHAQQRYAQRQR